MKRLFSLVLFLFICLIINAQKDSCNNFNLTKPGLAPEEFVPEILNTNAFLFNVDMKTCNELYVTKIDRQENIYFSEKVNGQWKPLKIASFSNPNYNEADPFLTKDGTKMYFISTRPTFKGDKNLDYNIWVSIRGENGWLAPKPLPSPINSEDYDEYFFSISDLGNAFFASNRSGGEGSFDIYKVKVLENDTFSEPKNVGLPLSTAQYEFDPYISPDEQLMLFSISKNGDSDLYFSYKNEANNWVKPIIFGDEINLTNQDFAPSLSPEGKYIFYSNNGKLKWISSKILENLKHK